MLTTVLSRSPVKLLIRSLRSFFCSKVNSGSSSFGLATRRRFSLGVFLSLLAAAPPRATRPLLADRSAFLFLFDFSDEICCVMLARCRSNSAIL